MQSVAIPFKDYYPLQTKWIELPGITCVPNENLGYADFCYFPFTSCSQVSGLFQSLTVVITRDKYLIPPHNYLQDS